MECLYSESQTRTTADPARAFHIIYIHSSEIWLDSSTVFEVRMSGDCFWTLCLIEPRFARDICTDTTTLVSHSRMDAGQARLTANAGQGFDAGPVTVWHVWVCEKQHNLETAYSTSLGWQMYTITFGRWKSKVADITLIEALHYSKLTLPMISNDSLCLQPVYEVPRN